ncbi:MAG: cadherin-like domain-containing protein [Verrucomicrobiae bacterium]|nr:cadherin-like domain-containing protein [Verrucomicrobiae bacterium]
MKKVLITTVTLLAGLLVGRAAFVELDTFNRLTNGPIGGRNGWVTSQSAFVVTNDPAGGPNKVLAALAMSESPVYKPLGALTITNGTTGTLFFRMRRADSAPNVSVGMSDVTAPTSSFADFEAQINCNTVGGTLNVRDAGTFDAVDTFNPNIWYKVWMVIDNAADLTRVYMQGGHLGTQTLLDGNDGETYFTFRNTTGDGFNGNTTPVANHLVTFLIRVGSGHTGPFYIDDIYVDPQGMNLSDPALDVAPPEVIQVVPAAGSTVSGVFQATITFNEMVGGVTASSLLLNGLPATNVVGGPEVYTFQFDAPTPGPLTLSWNNSHGIVDYAGNAFPGTNIWQYTYTTDLTPPAILSVSPGPGSLITNWGGLTILVSFNELVTGVEAEDLLINGLPALAVTNQGASYYFKAPQPLSGPVAIRFAANHGIKDLFNNSFDAELPAHQWTYDFTDTVPPFVAVVTPAPAQLVLSLDSIEVVFNEEVNGVDAGDLLVNGVAATSLVGSGAGPYRFSFPAPIAGPVRLEWAASHQIVDRNGLPFAGGAWQVMLAAIRPSGFVLFEDFQALTPGPLNGQNNWLASNEVQVVADPVEPRNRVLCISNSTTADAWRALGPLTISNNVTATVFWRFRRADTDVNMSHGLSDSLPPASRNFADFEAQLQSNGSGLTPLNARDAGAFKGLRVFTPNVWFSVWLVVDNANDLYRVYLQGDDLTVPTLMTSTADPSEFAFTFRNTTGDGINLNTGPVVSNLTVFLIRASGSVNHVGPFYLDDIYVDLLGANLANPLPPPKPAGVEIFPGTAEATLVWAPVPGVTNYIVKRGTTTGGPYQRLGTNNDVFFTDSTPDVNTTYYYVVSALGVNGESFDSEEVFLRINTPPLAGQTNWQVTANTSVTRSADVLLALCTDVENDALTLVAVQAGTNGATVTLADGLITYAPPPGFVGQDQFTYTVRDARGGTSQGVVRVEVVMPPAQPMPLLAPRFTIGGGFAFEFAGQPGRTYIIERAVDISGPWSTVAEIPGAAEGRTPFVDSQPPAGRAFYRLRTP